MIIVKSKIKEVVKNCNVAGDFSEKLNELAVNLIRDAEKRAQANGRKTVQGKDVYIGDKTAKVMLVVKSKIKEVLKGSNVGGDFADALNEVLVWYVKQACERAQANGRKTVSARDL